MDAYGGRDIMFMELTFRGESIEFNAFTSGEIVVTYPEALFEEVVAPEVLNANRIHITVGENVDVDTMIEILTDYGFQREDFVYEPGQFSIRGGIIDIFSYGNEWPYRIELFDEEIESIRTFNPTSQLSLKNIERVSIIPNINSGFKQEEKVPFFSVFSKNTIVWIRDLDIILDKLQQCFEKVEDFAKTLNSNTEEELRKVYPKE